MADARWHFRRKRPDDTSREAIGAEFFTNDSLREGFPQGLVREGIQNSLDALVGPGPVRVRIHTSGSGIAEGDPKLAPYVNSLFPHLAATTDTRLSYPTSAESCQFLVFEDFETSGLEGDTRQWASSPVSSEVGGKSKSSAFFGFIRAEGVSAKTEHARGRWGIGKFVFPRSSRAQAFFAVTVRASDAGRTPILIGRAILRGHMLNGSEHVPDGYFGLLEKIEGSDFVAPVADETIVGEFSSLFELHRGRRPGLSVVIPWYLEKELALDKLVAAVIREYFLPIILGRLVVEVSGPSAKFVLDAEHLDGCVKSLGAGFVAEMAPLIALAIHAKSPSAKRFTLSRHDDGPLKWNDSLVPEVVRQQVKTELAASRPVALTVPVRIRPKKLMPQDSFFVVYLIQDSDREHAVTTFVREDISVPGHRAVRVPEHRALIHIESGPLAELLGNAENPSHTHWAKDGSNFRSRYEHGDSYLNFVKHAGRRILEAVNGGQDEADPRLLNDIFYRSSAGDGRVPGSVPNRGGERRGGPSGPPVISPAPKYFAVNETESGFTFRNGPDPVPVSAVINVSVAYDVRSGDPFKRFDRADFTFHKSDIEVIHSRGLNVTVASDNVLVLRTTGAAFGFEVRGFDPNRDLVVRTELKEVPDGGTSA